MYGILILLIGAISLYYSGRFLKDPEFAKDYIQKSPKAFIWRKMLGEEKALKLTKTVFAPIGLVLGIILVLLGLYTLLG